MRDLGQLDNTVLVVLADNGASQEGGPFGVMHEMKFFNGILETPDEAIERIDDIGGPNSHTNYPWGWAQCGNSPFKWYKQNTHEGGVHVPMVLHWPAGLDADQKGTLRSQFVNVADVAPTVYELLGIEPPAVFNGRDQLPVTGHSFASVLGDAAAPATNRLQYFEQFGSRALVVEQEGRWWKAVAKHTQGVPFDDDPWELYDLSADYSECNDLAAAEPAKLAELVALWFSEAERNGVLPLDDRLIELFGSRLNDHSPHPTHRRYRYRPPMSPIPAQATPSPGGRSWAMTATVDRQAGDQGVIWATGTANSGVSVFVQDDRLVVDYNAFDDHTIIESTSKIPTGASTLGVVIARNSRTTGGIDLTIDGEPCGRAELSFMMRMISSLGSSIGFDHGSAVSSRYQGPFPFSGALHEVEIQLSQRSKAETATEAKSEMSRQ